MNFPPLKEWGIPSFLAKQKIWHIALAKVPQARPSWKDQSCLLTIEEAYQLLLDYQGDKPACLMLNLQLAQIKILDFDRDKKTGRLREDQQSLVDHCCTYTHVRVSMSGVGRHGYICDPHNRLPKIASSVVEKKLAPCEVKTDIIFVTHDVISDWHVAEVDQRTVDLLSKKVTKNKIVTTKQIGRTTSQAPEPLVPSSVSATRRLMVDRGERTDLRNHPRAAVHLRRMRELMDMVIERKINILTGNASFSRLVISLKSIGMANEEIHAFCRQQDGYKDDVMARIASTNARDDIEEQAEWGYQLFAKFGCILETPDTPPMTAGDTVMVFATGGHVIDYLACLDKLGFKIRNNEHLGIQYLNPNDPETWHDWKNDTEHYIYTQVQRRCRNSAKKGAVFNFTESARNSAINNLVTENKYNGFREYLNQLIIDGKAVECLEARDLFMKIFKIDPEEELINAGHSLDDIRDFYRSVASNLGLGTVRRTMTPGCVHDNFIVLIGAQGCGKSLTLSLLVPPHLKCFVEEVDMALESSERILACQKGSLVECNEMIGIGRKEIAAFKAMISEGTPLARPKYGRKHERIPLHYLMVGTANEVEYRPGDSTGERRTIPVPVGRLDKWNDEEVFEELPKIIDEWRDHFFGDCLYRLMQGETGLLQTWSKGAKEVRQTMLAKTEHRSYRLEEVIKMVRGKLSDEEITRGLPFSVPPTEQSVRSVMQIIHSSEDVQEKLRYKVFPPTAYKSVMNAMGWIFKGQRRYGGRDSKRCYRICKPPEHTTEQRPKEEKKILYTNLFNQENRPEDDK